MTDVSYPVKRHDKGMLAILALCLLTEASLACESPDKWMLAILVSLTGERPDD